MIIDVGGTPANILEKNNFFKAKACGIKTEEIIAILDPFDLSRAERTLLLGDYKIGKIKFSVEVPNNQTNLSSEQVKVLPEECGRLLEAAEASMIGKIQSIYGKRIDIEKIKANYSKLIEGVMNLAENSKNLREFMNDLVKFMAPELKTILLEEILRNNLGVVYELLQKTDIPVRAICPYCSCFFDSTLRTLEFCPLCNEKIKSDELIKSGRYIPQSGFLPVIVWLCRYSIFSNSQEKKEQINRIMKTIEKQGNPLYGYTELKEKRTMFESFLFADEIIIFLNYGELNKPLEKEGLKWKT